jgi:predicted RNase H-like HicB family nuclease
MLRYAVKLSKDTNDTILVDVPAIPEAHTFGEDREEALARAVDAIETALMATSKTAAISLGRTRNRIVEHSHPYPL